jgi:hypothetical protein
MSAADISIAPTNAAVRAKAKIGLINCKKAVTKKASTAFSFLIARNFFE